MIGIGLGIRLCAGAAGAASSGAAVSGGTVTEATIGGTSYRLHTLAGGQTLVVTQSTMVDVLLIGAGGSGGVGRGGGGGAGEVEIRLGETLAPGSYPAAVPSGAGGVAVDGSGVTGGIASFNGWAANGGGAGGGGTAIGTREGAAGGSGGGAGGNTSGTAATGGASNAAGGGLGNTGGTAFSSATGALRAGGGGGGSGGAGGAGSSGTGGTAGTGTSSDFTGSTIVYGAGGAGATTETGGVAGATPGSGGSGTHTGTSGAGAGGTVVVRYPIGGSAPTGLTVSISPAAVQAGQTLTCTPSATGATSYTYQWTNAGVDISGATSATYANDGSFGSNAINCTVVAHNAAGDSAPAEAAADALIRWAGLVAVDGGNSTSDLAMDFGPVMPGQRNWLLCIGQAPAGNLTWEGVGPTAIASHAAYRQAPGAVANRQTYIFSNESTDQTQNVVFSSAMTSRTVWGFRTVGYALTPGTAVSNGNGASNQSPATATIDVAENGAILAAAVGYDGLTDPSGIVDFAPSQGSPFNGADFMKWTGGGSYAAGVGYVASANGSLGVQATRTAAATGNKHVTAVPLSPETPGSGGGLGFMSIGSTFMVA